VLFRSEEEHEVALEASLAVRAAANITSNASSLDAVVANDSFLDAAAANATSFEEVGGDATASKEAAEATARAEEVLADVEVQEFRQQAERAVEEQFPDIFKDAFGNAARVVAKQALQATASMLDSTLNSTLSIVYDSVRGLPEQCTRLREAMIIRVKGSSGSVSASLANFESAVSDAHVEFSSVWGSVVRALEGTLVAVPAALRVANLGDLASASEAWLGDGNGLLGLAEGVLAAVKNISSSVAGIGNSDIEKAGVQLKTMNEAVEDLLEKADGFGYSLKHGFANVTATATTTFHAAADSFSSSDQTSIAIVQAVSDSAQQLGKGVTEAASATGVKAAPTERSIAAAHGGLVIVGVAVLAAVGWC